MAGEGGDNEVSGYSENIDLFLKIFIKYRIWTINIKIYIKVDYSSLFTSDSGVAGCPGDAAGVVLVPGHVDVALHAPGHAPAVLHNPVTLQIASDIITNIITTRERGPDNIASMIVQSNMHDY